MKDRAHTNTYHANRPHARFVAAFALALAAAALFAVPSDEPFVCYRPDPVTFTGMSLTFRYDWREMREGQSVCIYRHDGSANGAWTRVGKAELSSVDNVITTDKFDASSETWNAGWFAVVAQNPGGATIIVR